MHPLPGVTIGTNCVMIGDWGQLPLTRSDGAILMPVQITPIGPDGKYYNPGGVIPSRIACCWWGTGRKMAACAGVVPSGCAVTQSAQSADWLSRRSPN